MEGRLPAAGRAQLLLGVTEEERTVTLLGTSATRRGKGLTQLGRAASGQVTCLSIPVARVRTCVVVSLGSWLLWLLALERAVFPVG